MQKVGIGQDFGFTNDPSAAVRCGIIDNRLYVDELFYETVKYMTKIWKHRILDYKPDA